MRLNEDFGHRAVPWVMVLCGVTVAVLVAMGIIQ
jgi:hypothetical protein